MSEDEIIGWNPYFCSVKVLTILIEVLINNFDILEERNRSVTQ